MLLWWFGGGKKNFGSAVGECFGDEYAPAVAAAISAQYCSESPSGQYSNSDVFQCVWRL